MKVRTINNTNVFSFKSLRTDKNNVATLKNGSNPILENKKENILTSLACIANNPNRANIEFLLDVAQNLNYGQNGNSEFRDIIDETTEAPIERENTDWQLVIGETIKQALSQSPEDVSDLEIAYKNLFNIKAPLSQQQKEILDLRNEFKKKVVNQNSLTDTDALTRSASVSKNIDYFISSSEISLPQKKECLEKFLYLLSDEYPIEPQLADKKIQILDEMLNDLLVKVPNEEILRTKGVNQLYSGICAAISICRKAVAYEDKPRYIDLVLEELKDSPTMEVYDVTDLESGKKVHIPKISIDYDTAILQGYRILDTSAHHWMQNAHASGDGTIQTETYTAFEDETFGIFNDSSWYECFNPELSNEKKLLKNLIREKELLDFVLKQKKKIKNASEQIEGAKKQRQETQTRLNGEINRAFSSIFPEMSSVDMSSLIRSVMDFYKGTKQNNEVNISSKMSLDVKKDVIADFIKEQTNTPVEDEQTNKAIDENAKKILSLIEEYVQEDIAVKQLSSYNSHKAQYTYYNRMFQLAAAHRMAMEADVNLNTGIVRYEKLSGLPGRNKQITSYLERLGKSFDKPEILEYYSRGQSKQETKKELLYDTIKVNDILTRQLDNISKTVFGFSTKEQTKQILSNVREQIKYGNTELAAMVSSVAGIKSDKTQIVNYIDRVIKKFDTDISDDEIDDAIRLLGFEDRIHMFKSTFMQFISHLTDGISQEEMQELAERFGGEDKVALAIQAEQDKFIQMNNEYNAILERWEVPSSRQLIIEKLEKDQNILSRKKLEVLKKKFDNVRYQQSQNENIENTKDRQKANKRLYEFTNDELDILRSIEKSLPFMKKYCKTGYNMLNKELFDELEKQYATIGMLNGQFWVREEGSSGLSSNEQVRIIEQMTGKPYHIQRDIEKAVKQVKKGDGSGIISYSVDDKSYAFHAQYVPSVTSEKLDAKSEQREDVIWTDNSWGKAEKEHFWNGRNGFNYTDYGSGYGWKNGFILANDLRIGQDVKSVKNSVGVDSKDNDEFSLLLDMVLPGTPVDAYQKLYKMFSYILSMDQGAEYFSALENVLKSGEKINVEYLEGLDGLVEQKTEALRKELDGIKTKEDFEKLPKDNYLRFVLEALSIYSATNNPTLADSVLMANSIEELEEIKEEMPEELIQEIGGIICKTDDTIEKLLFACNADITSVFDKIEKDYDVILDRQKRAEILNEIFMLNESSSKLESLDGSLIEFEKALLQQTEIAANENISDAKARKLFIEQVQGILRKEIDEYLRIKSLDTPVLVNSPLHDEFIAALDKYLAPTSDKDLLDLIIGLQNAGYEQANAFIDLLTPEDLGLDFKDPYEFVRMIKSGDSAANKSFSEIIASNIINSELKRSGSVEVPDEDDGNVNVQMSPDDLYRALYVKLADLDVQKYIRDFKAEAFMKYKVRQAFPQPIVIKDEEMEKTCVEMYQYFDGIMQDIDKNNFIITVFDVYSEIKKQMESTRLNELINEGKPFELDSTLREEISNILKILQPYSVYLGQDETLNLIKKPVDGLITSLSANSSVVDAKTAKQMFAEIQGVFDSWATSNVVREHFVQNNKESVEQIKNTTALLVNANIAPRYRNEAFERIHKIVSLMKNAENENELEFRQNEFMDFFINRHIIKDPTKLLSECVRMVQEGKEETQEYVILKSYLLKSLKVAQQTKAQYKMVQNAHEGITSKTRELLPMFSVKLTDGTKESMNSEMGMIYLINQLENESDHSTLKLFLAQTGLSKLSLNALINHFNGEKSLEIVNETYVEIMKSIDDFEKLNQLADKFMNLGKVPFKTLEEAVKYLREFVARKSKRNKDSGVFEKYFEYIDAIQIKKELQNASPDMILPLVSSLNRDAIAYSGESVNAKIDYLVGISKLLKDRNVLIETVDVPENSEEGIRRTEFRQEYEKIQQEIQDRLHSIQERIEKSEFMSASYVQE